MYNEILHHKNKVFAVLLLRHKLPQVCLCWSTNNSNKNNEKTISISILLYFLSKLNFMKNVVEFIFRRFNQWSLSFILWEKLCTSHWKIMPRLFHFLQKILENCKCTTSKCLIHSSLGLQAIYSAIIHGPIPKLSLVPYIPSNGTKRTRSFFGKSFPIIRVSISVSVFQISVSVIFREKFEFFGFFGFSGFYLPEIVLIRPKMSHFFFLLI